MKLSNAICALGCVVKTVITQELQNTAYDTFAQAPCPLTLMHRAQFLPSSFSLRQSSKVKCLFFPKISSRNLFNIYLMTCMNERVSCMENLIITFASSTISVSIVFTLQEYIQDGQLKKNVFWHSHYKENFPKTAMISSATCQNTHYAFLTRESLGAVLVPCAKLGSLYPFLHFQLSKMDYCLSLFFNFYFFL